MFKTVTVLVAGAAALGLAACAPGYHGPNETAGTAVGAIGGGLIGSQFGRGGGSVAGAAVGALLGGAIGNTVGRSADAQNYYNGYAPYPPAGYPAYGPPPVYYAPPPRPYYYYGPPAY